MWQGVWATDYSLKIDAYPEAFGHKQGFCTWMWLFGFSLRSCNSSTVWVGWQATHFGVTIPIPDSGKAELQHLWQRVFGNCFFLTRSSKTAWKNSLQTQSHCLHLPSESGELNDNKENKPQTSLVGGNHGLFWLHQNDVVNRKAVHKAWCPVTKTRSHPNNRR